MQISVSTDTALSATVKCFSLFASLPDSKRKLGIGLFYCHKNVQAISLAFENVIFIFLTLTKFFPTFLLTIFSPGAADEATTTGESKQTTNIGKIFVRNSN